VLGDQALTTRGEDLDADVGRAERLGDGGGDRRQLLLDALGALQPLGEPGHHAVRVLALTQHPPPDQPPQGRPQRHVHRGDQQEREQGGVSLPEALAEEPSRRR
jgi:hypothetical protein